VTPWESLLSAARVGAEWAWERLYQQLAPAVRGYLISQGAVDPDDLLGEIWLQVARGAKSFSGSEANFRSWVFLIAHNRIIDERRRRGRRPEVPVPEDASDGWAGQSQSAEHDALVRGEWDEVIRILDELSEDQREVLALRILGQLTIDEVSEVMGKSAGAVKALQRRGLQALRKKISEGVTL
jgi:RNA polymerase sigma factor (sigma-70 family)